MKAIFIRAGIVLCIASAIAFLIRWGWYTYRESEAQKIVNLHYERLKDARSGDRFMFGVEDADKDFRESARIRDEHSDAAAEALWNAWFWPLVIALAWPIVGWVIWGKKLFQRETQPPLQP